MGHKAQENINRHLNSHSVDLDSVGSFDGERFISRHIAFVYIKYMKKKRYRKDNTSFTDREGAVDIHHIMIK